MGLLPPEMTATPSAFAPSLTSPPRNEIFLPARDYDLAATLESGQVFRWHPCGDSWVGVVGRNVVCLRPTPEGIQAQTAGPQKNWDWLRDFLQTDVDLKKILATFPDDEPMRAAVAACRGLRVLRQEPWECLAAFILSANKQITQIRQIISQLCERFGEPLEPTPGLCSRRFFSFPSPEIIAAATEGELRACKMGFRAPHLRATARQIAGGRFDLQKISGLDLAAARAELMKLPGVGGKIADCVLLFAYGFDAAFPVDVWVQRALRRWYFPRRKISERKLREFAAAHFGPHAGYAQQYLFHFIRTKMK
jgi:N-glycosylase/DNA lyase